MNLSDKIKNTILKIGISDFENPLFYNCDIGIRLGISEYEDWEHYLKFDEEETIVNPEFIKNTADKAYGVFKNFESTFDILRIDVIYDETEDYRKKIKKIIKTLNIDKPDEIVSDEFILEDNEVLKRKQLIWNLDSHKIDYYNIITEIAKTDFGGCSYLSYYTYFIDTFNSIVFNMYDDRGIDIVSSKKEQLYYIYKYYNNFILDYDRERIDRIFDGLENIKNFQINAYDFYWIDGTKDNKDDLCLHGDVSVRIEKEILSYSCCVSASALRMLETIKNDHYITNTGEQMLPCCGHSMFADENLENVYISGCDNGVDYEVKHNDNIVIIKTEKGNTYNIRLSDYKEEVVNFANKVQEFYNKCYEKILPKNDFEKNGYIAFWNEWKRLIKE
ncbi:MAG TPA: DUF3885 domain-containing protein [Candidatus Fimicola cottocaccae]|nr:DUF3885 domain-containing protein [Candidatus Fimicola cottocaccae]